MCHAYLAKFFAYMYIHHAHVRKETRPSPAYLSCKRRKAGRGLGTRLSDPLVMEMSCMSVEQFTGHKNRRYIYMYMYLEWPAMLCVYDCVLHVL